MCNLLAKEHVPENQMPERVRQELNELATGKKHWTVLFTRLSGVDRTWLWCIEDPAIKFWKDKVSCQLARTGPDSAPWTAVVAKLHLKKKIHPNMFSQRQYLCYFGLCTDHFEQVFKLPRASGNKSRIPLTGLQQQPKKELIYR